MLFLEECFKEEADHVTAMGNTTRIFHKTKEKQCNDSPRSVTPQVSDKGAVRLRADCAAVSLGQSQAACFPRDLIYLGNRVTSLALLLHGATHLCPSRKRGINPL